MKRKLALAALLLAAVLLPACAGDGAALGLENGDETANAAPYVGIIAPPQTPLPEPRTEPVYDFQAETDREELRHEDGTLLAYCDYRWQSLLVTNAERLCQEDLETAQRNVDAFNQRMREQAEAAQSDGVADYARDAYEEGYTAGLPYYEEMSAQSEIRGRIVSVRQDYYYNTGGAHPNYATGSLVFDLTAGQFIAPVQVADDPAAFHAAAAELLIGKADEMGSDYVESYWPDYRDTIRLWDSTAAVLFDEGGMTVIFSPYDLGPFALGSVELRLEREELETLIGPGGMEKLGWMEETAE